MWNSGRWTVFRRGFALRIACSLVRRAAVFILFFPNLRRQSCREESRKYRKDSEEEENTESS